MSNTRLYTSDTSSDKKVLLSGYFEKINTALDAIGEVTISGVWDCGEGTNLNTKFEDLKSKIATIKKTLGDYDDFLGIVNNEYTETVSAINHTVATYNKDA